MFANNLNTITTKSMKSISFAFRTIASFVFGAIEGFVFYAITDFVFVAINLLCDYGREYLLQIKVKLKKTVVFLDKSYLHYVYFYQCFCCKC